MNSVKTDQSGNRFLEEFNRVELSNFHASHRINDYFPNIAQPSTSGWKRPPSKFQDNNAKKDFSLMPVPSGSRSAANTSVTASISAVPVPTTSVLVKKNGQDGNDIDPILHNPGRGLKIISGRVDFVVKMHKLYPTILALFEVYGILLKISTGKIKSEHIILLRSTSGPVMQAEYYNYNVDNLDLIQGCNVFCVGRYKTEGRFQIFKIKKIVEQPTEDVFARIQNICSFCLNNNK